MTDPLQLVVSPLAPASNVTLLVSDPYSQVKVDPLALAYSPQTFEMLAKNINGLPFVHQRDAQSRLTKVVYGGGKVVKTLKRTNAGKLEAVVLSGSALGQRTLTKRMLRDTNGVLTGAAYEIDEAT